MLFNRLHRRSRQEPIGSLFVHRSLFFAVLRNVPGVQPFVLIPGPMPHESAGYFAIKLGPSGLQQRKLF